MTVSSAEIAQLVEHFTRNEGVEGSSPFFSLVQKSLKRQYLQGFQAFLFVFFEQEHLFGKSPKILKNSLKNP